MTQNLIDTTFTAKNIATAISVYEYTAAAAGYLGFQVRLAAVAGGGDYICYLTLNDGDVQSDDIVTPKITYTAAAGETAFWFANLAVDVLAGDVVNVFVKGLAGDTNEAGSVRIFSDNYLSPTVNGRTLDVSATGEAGLDWANIGSPSTAQNLSATIIEDVNDVETYLSIFVSKDADTLAIKAKTDVLPAYPADQSLLMAAIAGIPTAPSASAIDTQLSSAHGAGAWGSGAGTGAISKTVTVTVSGEPRDGVEVWVTTDSAGVNVVANGVTDAFGNVTFLLDTGSYYVWKQLAGVNFTNPQDMEV